jgi:hypothetical protein
VILDLTRASIDPPAAGESNGTLTLDLPLTGGPNLHVVADPAAEINNKEGLLMTSSPTLEGILAEHVAAVNGFDEDAIVATFADDALVNDAHREFWGAEAIRRWVAKEMVGDKVTIEVTEIIDHRGATIVRGRYDGEFDKTDLPEELILTNYFTECAGKIVSLIVIRNTPAY